MIRHIVAWNHLDSFSAEEKEQHAQEIKAKLEELPQWIDNIASIEVLTHPMSSCTRDMVLVSVFPDEEALAAYQVHPEHKKVSAFVRSVMTDRICVDYQE